MPVTNWLRIVVLLLAHCVQSIPAVGDLLPNGNPISSHSTDAIVCRLPGSSAQLRPVFGRGMSTNASFITLSCDSNKKAGVGNSLTFFPAAYFYAMLSGRDLLINDRSAMGGFCSAFVCGVPFLREVDDASGSIGNYAAPTATAYSFARSFTVGGEASLAGLRVLQAHGYMGHVARWWVDPLPIPGAARCISRLTGCPALDVACATRFAMQHLVRGPFRPAAASALRSHIRGLSDGEASALLTQPFDTIEPFDIAIQLRLQLSSLEQGGNKTALAEEGREWIADPKSKQVIDDIMRALSKYLDERSRQWRGTGSRRKTPMVFVSTDNSIVKTHLVEVLQNRTGRDAVTVVHFDNDKIVHTKHFPTGSHFDPLLYTDIAFDWVCLAISNIVISFRGSFDLPSSFAQSATRVFKSTALASDGHSKLMQLVTSTSRTDYWLRPNDYNDLIFCDENQTVCPQTGP